MDETQKLKKDISFLTQKVKTLEDIILGFKDNPVFRAKITKIAQDITNINNSTTSAYLDIPSPTELTINSGVITVAQAYHTIDTEGDGASDDLNTINDAGLDDNSILVLRAESSTRSVVLKDDVDNLRLNGDCTLDHSRDTITLIGSGGLWYELARSNNDS